MNTTHPFEIHNIDGYAFIAATDLHAALVTWQAYEPWIMTHLVLSGAERGVDCHVEGDDFTTARLSLPLAEAILTHLPDDMDGAAALQRLQVTRRLILNGSVNA